MNMQLGYFPAYVLLFLVGIKSRRNEWFGKLDYAIGKPWLIWGILLGFVLFFIIMLSGGALNGNLDPFNGGITWQSAAYSLWDSFVVVAMSIGLLALFKDKYNNQNGLVRTMSRNAFSVYVFHAPIIVALSLLFAPVNLIPIVKFVITTIIGIPICFLITNFTIQRIPFLKKLYM
jgi:fucose 4-O-acetylase-like acetyltransferase